jgi:leukotriene-A4 hydrolase
MRTRVASSTSSDSTILANMSPRKVILLAVALLACNADGRQSAPKPQAGSAATPPSTSTSAVPAEPAVAATAAALTARDPNSYAEPEQVRIQHIALDLDVNFETHLLSGNVTLDLDWKEKASRALVLDTRDLAITQVEGDDGSGFREIPFELAARDAIFGSKLTIVAPTQPKRVRIAYTTSKDASGLQWLSPAMTAGGESPFMFTQSQAIHARSWVPLQDTPGVRFTYDAEIRTPKELMALMSADNDPNAARDGSYRFHMPQAIPSYLMALAVGDLVFRPISERSGVWAEPAVVEKARREFEDTEKMIATAEALYGPYRWGRYDILVLPPSFPFGGMENPRLTFATPTVIVGDKSLASLIAHELAHSWSGNLVTNASWKDMWLNEGFTSYVENRIVEAIYGSEAANMENVIGQRDLEKELKEVAPKDQVLAHEPLVGRDPDEVLTNVPYTKGQWFLRFLEERYGREPFDAFLRKWFDSHAFTSTDSAEFERFLKVELAGPHPGKTTAAELAAFLHEPGIPAFAGRAESARFAAVDAARTRWVAGEITASQLGSDDWCTHERVRFIEGLPDTVKKDRLRELDRALKLSGTSNGEIAMRWYPLSVRAGYGEARPAMAEFLTTIGRRKLVRPIYAALAKSDDGRAFGREVFAKAREGYHPITRGTIEGILAGK